MSETTKQISIIDWCQKSMNQKEKKNYASTLLAVLDRIRCKSESNFFYYRQQKMRMERK